MSKIHFCSECNNMLVLKINPEDDSLQYNCRNCGFESQKENVKNNCIIYEKNFCLNNITSTHNINKYTCKDPTLPRVNNIKCTNSECPTNTGEISDEDREVVYMKYDKNNMYFVYICCHCNNIWKNIS